MNGGSSWSRIGQSLRCGSVGGRITRFLPTIDFATVIRLKYALNQVLICREAPVPEGG